MAKQIRKEDISEKDIYAWIIESAEKGKTSVEEFDKVFTELADKMQKPIKPAAFTSQKEINKAIQSYSQWGKVAKTVEQSDRRRIETTNALAKSQKALLIEQQKQSEINRKRKLEAKQIAKLQLAEANSVEALRAKLGLVTTAWSKLTKEEQENTKRGKRLVASKKRLTEEISRLEQKTGDHRRNVGNYGSALDKLGMSFKKVGSLAAQFGLAMGGVQLLKGAASNVATFDQSIADLKAIVNPTEKDLKFFNEQAIELGKTTEGGAAAVVEAYKLIGSAKPELLKNAKSLDAVTQSAITLSKASGLDLPDAAKRLTDAMNQFGAPASEAGRFIDVLANGAQKGAAEVPQITESLLKFGAVAKTSNVSIEESTALIESLAEKGLKGAEAGTALRNVMLKMSAPDALPKKAQESLAALGVDMDKLKDTSIPFSERLEAMKPLLNDNAAMVKVFGTENAVAATNVLSSTDRIKELTEGMKEQGVASKQAKDRTATLGEAFKNIKRAWDSFILSLANDAGTSGLVDFLQWVADNLPFIIQQVFRLVKVFAIYKAITSQTAKQVAKFGKALKDMGLKKTISNMKDFVTGQKKANSGMKDGQKAAKGFGKALKSIGFAVAIEMALEVAAAIYDIASGQAELRRQTELSNAAIARGEKRAENFNKAIDERIKLQEQDLRLSKARGELGKTEAENDANFLKMQQMIRMQAIASAKIRKKELKDSIDRRQEQIKTHEQEIRIHKNNYGARRVAREQIAAQQVAIRGENAEYQSLALTIAELENELKELNISQEELNTERAKSIDLSDNDKKAQKQLNTEFKTQIDLISELNEINKERRSILQDVRDLNRADEIEEINDKIEEQIELEKARIDQDSMFTTSNIEALIEERNRLELEGIEERRKLEIQNAKESREEMLNDLKNDLDEQRTELLEQEGLTAEKRAEIEANYNAEIEKLGRLRNETQEKLADEILLINTEANSEIEKSNKKKNEDLLEADNELTEALISNIDTLTKAELEAQKQQQEELRDLMEEVGTQILDGFIARSQKKIEAIEKEIEASKKLEDELRESAKNQNAIASESLAAQENFTKDRIRAKQLEQKKQQRLDEIKVIYQAMLQFMEQGDSPTAATTKAIATTGIIRKAVEALPAFFKGTKTTVSDELGAPMFSGKDGYIVRVDGSEKVLNPSLSAMTGNATTDEIVDGFLYSQQISNGLLVPNYSLTERSSSTLDLKPLEKKVDNLTNVMKNKRETTFSNDVLLGVSRGLVENSRKGSTRNRTFYRS